MHALEGGSILTWMFCKYSEKLCSRWQYWLLVLPLQLLLILQKSQP